MPTSELNTPFPLRNPPVVEGFLLYPASGPTELLFLEPPSSSLGNRDIVRKLSVELHPAVLDIKERSARTMSFLDSCESIDHGYNDWEEEENHFGQTRGINAYLCEQQKLVVESIFPSADVCPPLSSSIQAQTEWARLQCYSIIERLLRSLDYEFVQARPDTLAFTKWIVSRASKDTGGHRRLKTEDCGYEVPSQSY